MTPLASVSAQVVWDETNMGDLSSDPSAPTGLTLGVGDNIIFGSVGGGAGGLADVRDYVTFTIGPGQSLVGLVQLVYVDVVTGGPGNRGFHAINSGSTSFIPDPVTAGMFLGGDHLDPLPAGTDMLPTLASAPLAGTGFSVPLGPGTYSYLVQQTGPELTAYSISLQVVPGPSALALLGLGGIAAMRRRR
jgi:hypothetical protein